MTKPRSALKQDLQQAQLRYIRSVIDRTGLTATAIARKAGLSHTVLTRFLNSPETAGTLETLTIGSIAAATGVTAPPDILGAAGQGMREPEARPYEADEAASAGALVPALTAMSGHNEHLVPWVMQGRALEHLGWRAGDILMVDLNAEPQAGDVVCAQVYDMDLMRAETVFRLYEPPFLIAAGPDPASLKPLSVGDRAVAVKGVVVATFRPRTARAA